MRIAVGPSALVLGALFAAPLSLAAQATTPAGPPVHHKPATTAAARARAASLAQAKTAAAEPAPALPPGVPAVEGKLATAFALRYVDSKIGDGEQVTPGEFITVHYTGWLASNGTKFDSSVDRGTPFTFPQGMHRVITGWDQGFAGMRIGGKRRLFIPYQLAYGDDGRPPVIPPKSDLIFDIELVGASATEPPPTTPTAPQ